MAFGTWTDGNQLGASDVNSKILQTKWVDKTANESVTSSTSIQNDDHLKFTAAASTNYLIKAYIMCDGASGAGLGITYGWYGPSGATFNWCSDAQGAGAGTSQGEVSRTRQTISSLPSMETAGAGTFLLIPAMGILQVSTTGGTFGFRWTQETSNATATRVLALSALFVAKLV